MTEEQIEEKLQPWLDFIVKHNLEVKINELNNFSTDDLTEYELLYKAYIDSGHVDYFHKWFGVFAIGIGIGAEGGTQLVIRYTGDKCDLNEMKVYE